MRLQFNLKNLNNLGICILSRTKDWKTEKWFCHCLQQAERSSFLTFPTLRISQRSATSRIWLVGAQSILVLRADCSWSQRSRFRRSSDWDRWSSVALVHSRSPTVFCPSNVLQCNRMKRMCCVFFSQKYHRKRLFDLWLDSNNTLLSRATHCFFYHGAWSNYAVCVVWIFLVLLPTSHFFLWTFSHTLWMWDTKPSLKTEFCSYLISRCCECCRWCWSACCQERWSVTARHPSCSRFPENLFHRTALDKSPSLTSPCWFQKGKSKAVLLLFLRLARLRNHLWFWSWVELILEPTLSSLLVSFSERTSVLTPRCVMISLFIISFFSLSVWCFSCAIVWHSQKTWKFVTQDERPPILFLASESHSSSSSDPFQQHLFTCFLSDDWGTHLKNFVVGK